MNWRPISNSAQYLKIIKSIYKSLDEEKSVISSSTDNVGLMGGSSGIALFYYYYGKLIHDNNIINKGLDQIEIGLNAINNGYSYHTFAGGIAGICWSISYVIQNGFINQNENETVGLLDNYLANSMISEIKSGNYDYLHGAIGIGLYFLNRFEINKSTVQYLNKLLDILGEMSINDNNGIKWISIIDIESGKKGYNLSLSHGISSIIVFLSKLYEKGIYREKVFGLLINSTNYLLSQKLDKNLYSSFFPNYELQNMDEIPFSRLAWCYGDLGIATSLWQAGTATNNEQWKKTSIQILLHSTKRTDLKENYINDGGFCHGTAGIAHIFNRMYHYTEIEEFKESAIYWLEQTLKMAKFEDGAAGYKAWRTPDYGGYVNEYGLLEGIAGIGLVFLAAISDIEPKWDRCLLLS